MESGRRAAAVQGSIVASRRSTFNVGDQGSLVQLTFFQAQADVQLPNQYPTTLHWNISIKIDKMIFQQGGS